MSCKNIFNFLAVILFTVAIGCTSQETGDGKGPIAKNNPPGDTTTPSTGDNDTTPPPTDEKETTPPAETVEKTPPAENVEKTPPVAGNHIDLSYITGDFFAALVVHPKQLSESSILKMLPQEEIAKQVSRELPLDPRHLEQFIIMAGPASAGFPITPGVILRFSEAKDASVFLGEMKDGINAVQASYNGKEYFKSKNKPIAAYSPDDRTFVLSEESLLKKMMAANDAESPLIEKLKLVDAKNDVIGILVVEPVRKFANAVVENNKEDIPPVVAPFTDVVNQLKTATLTFSIDSDTLLDLQLEGENDEAGGKLNEMAQGLLAMGKILYAGVRAQAAEKAPPESQPALKMIDSLIAGIKVSQADTTVAVAVKAPEGFADLPKLLEPAIAKAKEAAKRAQRMNNLKYLALAFHNFHDTFTTLPPASAKYQYYNDKADSPPMSWRVRILPYIDAPSMYEKYNKEEPWDSKHNKQLFESFQPETIQTLQLDEEGKTPYVVFTGPGTVFEGKKGIKFSQITDGTSNTLLVIEAPQSKAVPWSKPSDLVFDPKNPLAALGEIPEEGLVAAFCDGSVRRLSKEYLEKNLAAIITRNGGEDIEMP